jgi:hypothetical protein
VDDAGLRKILNRKGYGLASGIKSGIAEAAKLAKLRKEAGLEDSGSGPANDLEPDSGDESLCAKKLQIGYSGKVRVRIKFYRRRLADYSRAISEKALVDCLQYAGLIQGDSEKEIWLEDGGQEKVGTDEEERTEIILEYEGVNLDDPWIPAKQNLAR